MRNNQADSDILNIDLSRLDEEWLRQPRLVGSYAEQVANAREEMALAKADFELVEAELKLEVQKDPSAFNLEKATQGCIESAVVACKRYQRAQRQYIKTKHQVDVLEAVVSALEHKKRGLEKLVDLHLADYFSAPRPSERAKAHVGKVEGRGLRSKGKKRTRE